MQNYYDPESGTWVTDWDRFQAVASQPPFDDLSGDVCSAPKRGWSGILALLAAVPEDTVHFVGSGRLEDFVVLHGTEFVDAIEEECRSNPRFYRAVREINLRRGHLPPEVEARLVAAFGPGFELIDLDTDESGG